jgi:hypothetical protein
MHVSLASKRAKAHLKLWKYVNRADLGTAVLCACIQQRDRACQTWSRSPALVEERERHPGGISSVSFFLRKPLCKCLGRCKGDVSVHGLPSFCLEDVPCSGAVHARLREKKQSRLMSSIDAA